MNYTENYFNSVVCCKALMRKSTILMKNQHGDWIEIGTVYFSGCNLYIPSKSLKLIENNWYKIQRFLSNTKSLGKCFIIRSNTKHNFHNTTHSVQICNVSK